MLEKQELLEAKVEAHILEKQDQEKNLAVMIGKLARVLENSPAFSNPSAQREIRVKQVLQAADHWEAVEDDRVWSALGAGTLQLQKAMPKLEAALPDSGSDTAAPRDLLSGSDRTLAPRDLSASDRTLAPEEVEVALRSTPD